MTSEVSTTATIDAEIEAIRAEEAADLRPTRDVDCITQLPNAEQIRAERQARKEHRRELEAKKVEIVTAELAGVEVRSIELIEAEMGALREERRDLRESLKRLEVERNLALAIAKFEALPAQERAVITAAVLRAKGIPSGEKFGTPGT